VAVLSLCIFSVQARPNANAILLTTEITTPAFYKGKDKHRQVTNMIFRTGETDTATAALVSQLQRPWLVMPLLALRGGAVFCNSSSWHGRSDATPGCTTASSLFYHPGSTDTTLTRA
jgi:hypothetical protein